MKFASLPDRRAAHDPDALAVSDGQFSLSNAEFLGRVCAAANQLRESGVRPGDVVALKLPNRVEFVVLMFAAWRLGASMTPINPSMTRSESARQLADSRSVLLVLDNDEQYDGVATLALRDLRVERTTDGNGQAPGAPSVDPSALALLIYTSGTTGVPKGVMLDHANIDAMCAMGMRALRVGPKDRSLLILPLFHVNGIIVSVLMPLLAGGSVVVANGFQPGTFFDMVEAERPTYFSAVPTILNMLVSLPETVRPDTSSLRFGICGAAPAPADLLARFEERFDFPIIEGYGLSEGTCATTVNPIEGPRRAGTTGVPFPGQQVRIIDESGAVLPPGVDGEVIVKGPNVMRGYLGRPEETARTIVDGWLHTGDLGHLDADGYLTLVGRSKDMIIRGGENIYPKEIEDVLQGDAAVLETAVIGVPDEKWGEVVVAYVQGRPGFAVDTDALAARCAESLSGYKRPTQILVIDSIPKNAVGKLDKVMLRHAHAKALLEGSTA